MAGLKDILDGYRVTASNGKVQRSEVVDPSNGQIADAASPVLPWDDHLGKTAPDDVVQQVKDVRAKIAAAAPALPTAKPNNDADFVLSRCKKDRCYMFAEGGAFRATIVGELGAKADALKASMLDAADPAKATKLRIEYMKTMAFKHLMNGREGPTSAVNTYDKAIFTWGMGFAAMGGLPGVLSRIYEAEKAATSEMDKQHVQKLFYLAGFMKSGGKYWVLDTETGKVHADPTDKPDEAYRVIHDTTELHQMWALAARDDLTRERVTRANFDAFVARTGNVPQAAKIQTAALYTFIAHLQHWTGDSFDVMEWATDPLANPKLVNPLPSEKGDGELAVQMVQRFYRKRSPDWNKNAFVQVRKYWAEMVGDDTKDEKLTEFAPSYSIMTNPPVDTVPGDHLGGTIAGSKQLYDLGPLVDFRRAAAPPPPTDGPPVDPPPSSTPTPDPPPPPPAEKEPVEPKWRCFPDGTPIDTPSGPRSIEALEEGDPVLSFDEREGVVRPSVIRARARHAPTPCLRLHASDGSTVDVTANHPLLTTLGWVDAGELRAGSIVRSRRPDGALTDVEITRVEALPPDGRSVHDLSVEPYSTFFAGGLLAHNKFF